MNQPYVNPSPESAIEQAPPAALQPHGVYGHNQGGPDAADELHERTEQILERGFAGGEASTVPQSPSAGTIASGGLGHISQQRRNNNAGGRQSNGPRDSLRQYLHEIGQTPLLDEAEEVELAQTIERGREVQAAVSKGEKPTAVQRREIRKGEQAKDRFIRANLRLVVDIAKRYPLPPTMELLDLIQEGNLGMEHAVDKFDWRKGFKFSTYATFWIRQAIGRGIDKRAGSVYIPSEHQAALRRALRKQTDDGPLEDPGLERLRRLSPTSLNQTINDGDTELGELVAVAPDDPASEVTEGVFNEQLMEHLRNTNLTERQFTIIIMYLQGNTYAAIGRTLGVTSETVRSTAKRAFVELSMDSDLRQLYDEM